MPTHDDSKYHLEAIVVMCEDLPRLVNLPGNVSGIRKCSEGKGADIIIADNTQRIHSNCVKPVSFGLHPLNVNGVRQ